jgi:hypothetical protein
MAILRHFYLGYSYYFNALIILLCVGAVSPAIRL